MDRMEEEARRRLEAEERAEALARELAEAPLDEVAYVRFASVYRRFQEATDFVSEVKKLESKE